MLAGSRGLDSARVDCSGAESWLAERTDAAQSGFDMTISATVAQYNRTKNNKTNKATMTIAIHKMTPYLFPPSVQDEVYSGEASVFQ